MTKTLVVLLLGLAMGYHWGYDEGWAGKPSIVARSLDRFGTSKVRAAREANDKRIEEASKP
jgi:hypothetical protein